MQCLQYFAMLSKQKVYLIIRRRAPSGECNVSNFLQCCLSRKCTSQSEGEHHLENELSAIFCNVVSAENVPHNQKESTIWRLQCLEYFSMLPKQKMCRRHRLSFKSICIGAHRRNELFIQENFDMQKNNGYLKLRLFKIKLRAEHTSIFRLQKILR